MHDISPSMPMLSLGVTMLSKVDGVLKVEIKLMIANTNKTL
jgi:hypothetical protein